MKAAFHIRSATAADLPGIVALERSVPAAPHWSADVYGAILAAAMQVENSCQLRRCLLVAEEQGSERRLLGFAAGATVATGSAELESVTVAEFARRRGIGEGLCLGIAAWARSARAAELLLEVRSSSGSALALYRKLGFESVGTRPHYYKDPEDSAVLMRLALGTVR